MPLHSDRSDRAPRILLVRLSAIGDAIHAMPIACAVRERFPRAMLAWVVEDRAAALLHGHEALDELIVLPRGWLKSPRIVWQLHRRLRNLQLDTAIDVQGLTKAAIVARLSGARRRIGFARPWGREFSPWLNNELVDTTATHVVDSNLQLLRPLGIELPEVHFRVPEPPSAGESAERIIADHDMEDGFAVFNSGAGWASKLWPGERYAAVAQHLDRRRNLPTLIVWGSPCERIEAERIAAASRGSARVAPPTTLTELAAVARRGQLFVGSDTGPLHIAAAVATPCIGLYGPWPAERHGPYGAKHIALQEMTFTGSTRGRRKASSAYMEAIGVELVCHACDRVLERRSTRTVASVGEAGTDGAAVALPRP
ncbi:MAG: glycosyltransferase family 9 protein [Candidatus Nealsonbacteria bacterium]|nr:glycosyltransferase family 9 protein [Candidatus Nealsonbacteria bacterium]